MEARFTGRQSGSRACIFNQNDLHPYNLDLHPWKLHLLTSILLNLLVKGKNMEDGLQVRGERAKYL